MLRLPEPLDKLLFENHGLIDIELHIIDNILTEEMPDVLGNDIPHIPENNPIIVLNPEPHLMNKDLLLPEPLPLLRRLQLPTLIFL